MELDELHPDLPEPVDLFTMTYSACGDKLCVTVSDAERDARNKVEIGAWMDKSKNLIRYYRNRTAKPHASSK